AARRVAAVVRARLRVVAPERRPRDTSHGRVAALGAVARVAVVAHHRIVAAYPGVAAVGRACVPVGAVTVADAAARSREGIETSGAGGVVGSGRADVHGRRAQEVLNLR